MKNFIQEFKKFAIKGNVIDLAVGVIIGGAFGKIVSSLVQDIIMPLVGIITGGINFTELNWTIKVANRPAVVFAYGKFLQNVVDFLIIAICIFVFVKLINKFKKKEETKPSQPAADIILLTEIRDLLKKSGSKNKVAR